MRGAPFCTETGMSISMIQAFKTSGTGPTERLVAYMLADHLNDATGRCDPSGALLMQETGLDDRTITRAIQRLEEEGHITVTRKPGVRSTYKLHPQPSKPPSESHPRHRVTPVSVTGPPPSESQGNPRHSDGGPPSESRPNHKNRKSNRNLNHKGPELGLGPAEEKTSKAKAGSLDEVLAFASASSIPAVSGEIFWDKMEACGWMRGNHKVKDWKAHFRMHYRLGYLTPKDNGSRYARPEEKLADNMAADPKIGF